MKGVFIRSAEVQECRSAGVRLELDVDKLLGFRIGIDIDCK
jgi:hypothetical protein